MTGAGFAFLAALCFGTASAAIAKGSKVKRGDNGALLSIVLTCLLSGVLWFVIGPSYEQGLCTEGLWLGIAIFVVGGVLATVIGRTMMFKSVALAGAINASLFRRLIPLFAALIAFAVLGETIAALAITGMVITVASLMIVLFDRSPQAVASGELKLRQPAGELGPISSAYSSLRLGQMLGTASAASYGASYVVRKMAMRHLPDPALGAFVGAVTGLVWYLAAALFNKRYRQTFRGLFRDTGRWQFIAAASMSFGQTSQFFALQNADVAVVAIIGSLEVFIGAYLAAYVLRTEAKPNMRIIIASIVATIGVALVAISS